MVPIFLPLGSKNGGGHGGRDRIEKMKTSASVLLKKFPMVFCLHRIFEPLIDFTVINKDFISLQQCAGEEVMGNITDQQVDILTNFTWKTINKHKYFM